MAATLFARWGWGSLGSSRCVQGDTAWGEPGRAPAHLEQEAGTELEASPENTAGRRGTALTGFPGPGASRTRAWELRALQLPVSTRRRIRGRSGLRQVTEVTKLLIVHRLIFS